MVVGGTRMVCLSTTLAALSARAGPLSKAALAAALLAGSAWTSASRADPFGPPPVDFFFDLVGDRLADAEPIDRDPARMRIAGVPLRFDAREGGEEAEQRLTAGASGRYALQFAHEFGMVGSARIAGTDFIDDRTPGAAVASAGADFRFAAGGWSLGLKPGLEVMRQESGFAQRDSVVEGRASKAIGRGLSMAATGRYRWRETIDGEELDRRIASGRLGFASQLPHDLRMDVAYVGRREVVEHGLEFGQPSEIRSLGPSIAVGLPLEPDLDLSANYEFSERAAYEAADGDPGWRREELHRLSIALTWALGGDPDAVRLSAGYRLEHGGQPADQAQTRHAGTLDLAVFF